MMNDNKQKVWDAAHELRNVYFQMIPLAGSKDEVKEVRDITVFAKNPSRNIPLRVYFPLLKQPQTALPIFLFIHGGGFVAGDIETHDVLSRAVSNGSECIVVSVDYRLAPEHPFPAGLDDVYAALLWCKDNASNFGGDSSRIVVGGDSAGGNLAAALTILSRDRKETNIIGQWLMYPTLSNKMDTESWTRLGDMHFPTKEINTMVVSAYVGESATPYEPLVAPFWADLQNLPYALIQAGGLDPLSDEDKEYAQKLEKSGNKVKFLFYPEYEHGFIQFYKDEKTYPNAIKALNHGLEWLKEIFSR